MFRRFEPLLSSKLFNEDKAVFEKNMASVVFPVFGSTKYDGWRIFEYNGKPHTRSLKLPKNYHVVDVLSDFYAYMKRTHNLVGLDGEALAGDPYDFNAMQNSSSAFNTYLGEPEFGYYLFDTYQNSDHGYDARLARLIACMDVETRSRYPWVTLVEQRLLWNWDEVWAYEADELAKGAEGIMLRAVDGRYKMGRSTFKDRTLTALKRFVDDEGQILEIIEEMENTNPQELDNFGRSRRSGHKAGMIGKGRMGAVLLKSKKFEKTFTVGMGKGLTHDLRQYIWDHKEEFLGEFLTYTYQEIGVKDRPRLPKWKAIRARRDMQK